MAVTRADRSIRIGIIGTGAMAAAHAAAFRQIRGARVTACLDVVPGRAAAFAATHRIALATDDRARLFADVDAVSIVTPDRFHAETTIAAFAAGKHVLCEKPLTVTLDVARAVAAAAAARPDLIGMINLSYRRSAAAGAAARLIGAGRLGMLRHVHAHYLQSWLSSDLWGNWTSEMFLWRLQTEAGSGGVLADTGVHILDLTTAVAGPVARLRCELRSFAKIHDGVPCTQWHGKVLDASDSALVQLDFAGGALGVVQATRWATGHANHLRVEVHGTGGALWFDLDQSFERLHVCLGRDVHRAAWRIRELKPAADLWQRFCRAINTGRAGQPDIARGAQAQALLAACQQSAASGEWTAIPGILPAAPEKAS
jgi:predicted dehydrogenase